MSSSRWFSVGAAGTGVSYESHLRGRYTAQLNADPIVDGMSDALSRQTRDLCGSLDNINRSAQDIRVAVQETNAILDLGLSQLLVEVGGIADTLDVLRKLAENPGQTQAYEHFNIARDNHSKGWFAECLDELDRAIEGVEGVSPGLRTEWRFHHLRGLVLIGSCAKGSADIMDPAKAEEAFLLAARYAAPEAPRDAAMAFLLAGWAAYVQAPQADDAGEWAVDPDKLKAAVQHTADARRLNPALTEAWFQGAKVLMAAGEPETALPLLQEAMTRNGEFVSRASADPDFLQHASVFESFIERVYSDAKKKAAVLATEALRKYDRLANRRAVTERWTALVGDTSDMNLPTLLDYIRVGLEEDHREAARGLEEQQKTQQDEEQRQEEFQAEAKEILANARTLGLEAPTFSDFLTRAELDAAESTVESVLEKRLGRALTIQTWIRRVVGLALVAFGVSTYFVDESTLLQWVPLTPNFVEQGKQFTVHYDLRGIYRILVPLFLLTALLIGLGRPNREAVRALLLRKSSLTEAIVLECFWFFGALILVLVGTKAVFPFFGWFVLPAFEGWHDSGWYNLDVSGPTSALVLLFLSSWALGLLRPQDVPRRMSVYMGSLLLVGSMVVGLGFRFQQFEEYADPCGVMMGIQLPGADVHGSSPPSWDTSHVFPWEHRAEATWYRAKAEECQAHLESDPRDHLALRCLSAAVETADGRRGAKWTPCKRLFEACRVSYPALSQEPQ